MKCKFCGNDKPLIEAHIIPAVFYRRISRPGKPLVIKTNKPGQYDKKSWKGVYDSSIVCIDCERLWSEWDNYAQQLLAEQPLNGEAIYVQNRKVAYLVRDYDYTKLKLFFISMLWRASSSSQTVFSKVSLGDFESIIKQHIAKGDPGDRDDFGVFLAKFDARSILDPHEDSYVGVNYFRFYLGSYIAYIKVDYKPVPEQWSFITMAPDKPLYMIHRDFFKSKELNLMRKLESG